MGVPMIEVIAAILFAFGVASLGVASVLVVWFGVERGIVSTSTASWIVWAITFACFLTLIVGITVVLG